MEQARTGSGRSAAGNLLDFLADALTPLLTRSLLWPIVALAILLTGSNIFILLNMPKSGTLPLPFIVAGLVRVVGLLVLEVAILRTITTSERPRWKLDGAFLLFVGIALLSILVSVAMGRLFGQEGTLAKTMSNLATTIILAPLAGWVAAVAVADPLAWRPRPYLRKFASWLPQILFWSIVLVTPIAVLHASLDAWLINGADEWFWPVALVDGPLSVLIALFGVGLNAAAYRRVARG
jgi:hypothetical protein